MPAASHLAASSSTSTVKPKAYTQAQALALTPAQSRTHNTVRTHLADFLPLPRHTLFHVRLTIHQLWNVPLISGKFSVRWKFQNVQSIRGNGLRAKVRASASTVVLAGNGNEGKGKGRTLSGESITEGSTNGSGSLGPSGSTASMHSLQSEGSSSNAPSPHIKAATLSMAVGEGLAGFTQESRGRTDYVELEEHNVKWGHQINAVVQMGVHRETMDLQACELKLVVEQLVVPGDPDAPQNPRLGAVYLNLAEYADEGPVTRRYLLRKGKTNATLQLTTEVMYVSGEKAYKSPPLQKGEVMAGVATLLENSPYGTLPRQSFSRRPSHNSAFGLGPALNNPHVQSTSALPSGSRSRAHSPNPESLNTTDNIIEAIFNPVPTSSTSPSPFTYYVPPKTRPTPPPLTLDNNSGTGSMGSGTGEGDDVPRSAVSRTTSISYSLSEDHGETGRAPSVSTHSEQSHSTCASRSSAGRVPQPRHWWQKLGHGQGRRDNASRSRPSSPMPPRSPNMPLSHLPSTQRSYSEGSSIDSSPALATHGQADDFTRLVSGNERHGAPQVFLRRPTSQSGSTHSSDGRGQRSMTLAY